MEYGTAPRGRGIGRVSQRLTTETKQAFKTTEFWAYVGVLAGLFIAGLAAEGLGADHVWLYAVVLSVGYMISRGIAKAGSYDPYTDQDHASDGNSVGDRLKAAAQVLAEGPDAARRDSSGAAETRTMGTPDDPDRPLR